MERPTEWRELSKRLACEFVREMWNGNKWDRNKRMRCGGEKFLADEFLLELKERRVVLPSQRARRLNSFPSNRRRENSGTAKGGVAMNTRLQNRLGHGVGAMVLDGSRDDLRYRVSIKVGWGLGA